MEMIVRDKVEISSEELRLINRAIEKRIIQLQDLLAVCKGETPEGAKQKELLTGRIEQNVKLQAKLQGGRCEV